MPMRWVPMPSGNASCLRVKEWAFYTMHGICPSSQFHSGNYAHSLFDMLGPMFMT